LIEYLQTLSATIEIPVKIWDIGDALGFPDRQSERNCIWGQNHTVKS